MWVEKKEAKLKKKLFKHVNEKHISYMVHTPTFLKKYPNAQSSK